MIPLLTHEQEMEFCRLRQAAIALNFPKLNKEQKEAVLTTEGPLLLLAGAGSGKTTVLIHRIANLIRYGCGSDSPRAATMPSGSPSRACARRRKCRRTTLVPSPALLMHQSSAFFLAMPVFDRAAHASHV